MSTTAKEEMKPITAEVYFGLTWDPTGTSKSEFELRSGLDELIAKFWKVGAKGNSAIGRTSEGEWKMTRSGFLGRKIVISRETGSAPVAEFNYSGIFGKGLLKFSDGRAIRWDRGDLQATSWCFFESSDAMLMQFKPMRKLWTEKCGVNVPHEAKHNSELPLLLLLGWFLIMIMARNEHLNTTSEEDPFYANKY